MQQKLRHLKEVFEASKGQKAKGKKTTKQAKKAVKKADTQAKTFSQRSKKQRAAASLGEGEAAAVEEAPAAAAAEEARAAAVEEAPPAAAAEGHEESEKPKRRAKVCAQLVSLEQQKVYKGHLGCFGHQNLNSPGMIHFVPRLFLFCLGVYIFLRRLCLYLNLFGRT